MIPIAKKYVGKRQHGSSRGHVKAIVVLSLLVLLLAAIFAAGILLQRGNIIFPNVTMCGVDVGGMTRNEAEQAVKAAVSGIYDSKDLTVTLPDRELVFLAEETQVALDMDKAMTAALEYGREGNLISCIVSWFECRKTSYDVDISQAFTLNTAYIRDTVEAAKEQVDTEMVDSTLNYNAATGRLEITVGRTGVTLDGEKLIAAVMDAYSRADFSGTRFDYDRRLYNPVDLTAFYRENCKPMRNATYVPETHSFLAEETGFGFDLEAAQQQVNMAKEGETLVFQLSSQEPTLTLEQLKKDMFTDILGRYDSPHTDNPPRTTNLVLAAQAIDGTILNPGEVFSFNAIVGERTPAKGYQPATIFGSGGASEAATGGGVCQVASAIYMATLLADLEVVERTEHMYVVDYVPWGMDATIYWDTNLDYKFRNSSSHPILIRTSVSDGFVHVDLYGVDERDYTVKMTYEVLSTYPWTDEYIQDDTKPVGYKYVKTTPYTGYHVVTYKTIVDKETGKDRTTSREDDSYYTKRNRVTIIGPEPEPTTPEDPNAPVTPAEPADPTPADPDTPGGMPAPGEPIVSTPADPDPTAPSGSQLPTVTPDTPYIEDP